jgi:hypothetical protein
MDIAAPRPYGPAMAGADISHHERVGTAPHRWHVHLRGREKPVLVELPDEERAGLDLSDDEIHDLLPIAFHRRHQHLPDHAAEAHEPREGGTWDAPVRVYQMHFMQ